MSGKIKPYDPETLHALGYVKLTEAEILALRVGVQCLRSDAWLYGLENVDAPVVKRAHVATEALKRVAAAAKVPLPPYRR